MSIATSQHDIAARSPRGSQFHSASVMLIEDNLADVRLTVELLREAKLANRLKVIANGSEAIEYLDSAGTAEHPLPDVILLDLNLPGTPGRGVLQHLRNDRRLMDIPVFVLTSSATHREMVEEEGLLADGYLEKPIDLGAFVRAICNVDGFWLELVCAPTRS